MDKEEVIELPSGAMLRVTKRDKSREGVQVMDKLVEIEILNKPTFIISKDYLAELCELVWKE